MPRSMRAKQRQQGRPKGREAPRTVRAAPYHHGSLRKALLDAAEHILESEGIQALTLRAAARKAGVSHAAPKNHFGDLSGLLSELAARGFGRFAAMMRAEVGTTGDAPQLHQPRQAHRVIQEGSPQLPNHCRRPQAHQGRSPVQ